MRRLACLATVCLVCTSCASIGWIGDGTSVARGATSDGRLVDGVRLPLDGDGYAVPKRWRRRGNLWGTDELVSMIVGIGRKLAVEVPGSTLYVADLSPHRGGPSAWHRSHQTGRDVDLLFFALDERGLPAPAPPEMYPFDADGRCGGKGRATVFFDDVRNWALVRALLEDPWADVQYIFIADPLKARLLRQAEASGAPRELIVQADVVLRQPVGALPHDDHMHVRIHCPPSDQSLGCRELGPLRWLKKGYKYLPVQTVWEKLPAPVRPVVERVLAGTVHRELLTHVWLHRFLAIPSRVGGTAMLTGR